jgi:SAM-dependent methyltransferase
VIPVMAAATLLDRLDLVLLRAAKIRRDHCKNGAEFYESFFSEDDVRKYLHDVRVHWRLGVLQMVYGDLYGDSSATVADVGCGLGMSRSFLPDAARFIGVEPSARTLVQAKRLSMGYSGEFRHGGFPNLPLDSESCDLVVCLEVLEHLEDDAAAAHELHRITKPGGHVLVSVPNTYYWPEHRELIGHHRHYSGTKLRSLLDNNDLEVVRGFPQFDHLWRAYYYTYLVFRLVETLRRRFGSPGYSMYESAVYKAFAEQLLQWVGHHSYDNNVASTFVLSRRHLDVVE